VAVVVSGTLVVLAVGLAGGLAGRALRVPGGSLLGAMVAVGALQLSSATTLQISPAWALLGQILVGSVIGSTIDRQMLRSFRRVLVPASIAVAATVLSGVLIGVTFAMLGFAAPLTALFGLAPGGFAEMTAAAVALGASGPLVATMHLVRVVAVIVLLPVILRMIARWGAGRDEARRRAAIDGQLETGPGGVRDER
jgi:membrane AbrB-like protein